MTLAGDMRSISPTVSLFNKVPRGNGCSPLKSEPPNSGITIAKSDVELAELDSSGGVRRVFGFRNFAWGA